MGGYGSGRRTNRPTTDDCITLTLSHLKLLGLPKRDCLSRRVVTWSSQGHKTAELTVVADAYYLDPQPSLKFTGYARGQRVDCTVALTCVPMRFGGERWYALCPMTGRKCTTLIIPPGRSRFASVKGWNVAYGSQRECDIHRAHRAIYNGQTRFKALSKYTRKPTRQRLKDKIMSRQLFVWEQTDRIASMLW